MIDQNGEDIFVREPLCWDDEIPVFSEQDFYTKNYIKIASDHLDSMDKGNGNPFIANETWVEMENSTRSLIEKYVPPGSRILDVGVGLGRLLAPLDQYKRYGVDISFGYLREARKTGIDVIYSKIEDLPYKEATFDAVIACDVLEHVLDLHQCCERLLRVLRPGGKLIVRVPLKEDLSPYLNPDLPYEFVHLRSFDEPSLRLLFEKVLGMQFIESLSASPTLQGTPRLKVQLLPDEVRTRVLINVKANKNLKILEPILKLSSEEFMNWIYNLRDDFPGEYNLIVNDLVLDMDINVVFEKTD